MFIKIGGLMKEIIFTVTQILTVVNIDILEQP